MAQYDVHRLTKGRGLVLDCQTHLLDHIDSRFVAPLVPRADAVLPARRLNPVFTIEGTEYVMLTESAAAVRRRDLEPAIASLADRDHEITNAFDFLLTGV